MEDGRSNVSQTPVFDRRRVVVRNIDERNRIQRVGGVRRTVIIDGVVGIAVVGDDDSLVIIGLGSLDNLLYTVVDSPHCFGDGMVNTCVTHHVTIGKIHHDEIILLRIDSTDELVLYLEGTHLRLQVVGCHLRRMNQNAVLTLERLLAAAVEEESHVCILLRFGCMQLTLAEPAEILAQGIYDIFFREEYVYPLEVGIIRVMQ